MDEDKAFKNYDEKSENLLKDLLVSEPPMEYVSSIERPYVDPFIDWAFKRIFASGPSKDVAKAFINEVLKGKREIQTITYGKNEYPGEIKDEGGAVLDFICTDADGTSFLVEVQRKQQSNFKERSLFYASRLISDQAQKGKQWKHELKAVYVISLLENFCLPETEKDVYLHNIALCDTEKGTLFYDKLHFTYIELKKFKKTEQALETGLDKWLYVLKNAYAMTEDPGFINEGKIKDFFELARQANFSTEERNMYRNAQQVAWDNYNALDYAKKKARKEGHNEGHKEGHKAGHKEGHKEGLVAKAIEVALEMKLSGIDIDNIVKFTKLSKDQIQDL